MEFKITDSSCCECSGGSSQQIVRGSKGISYHLRLILYNSNQGIKNMLSKRLKYKKANMFITRYRLDNRSLINPEQHTAPHDTYFNRIDMEKTLLSVVDGKYQNAEKNAKSNVSGRSKTQVANAATPYDTVKSQQNNESLPNSVSPNHIKMNKNISSELKYPGKPKEDELSATMRQIEAIRQEKDREKKNKEIYLTYLEYQQILNSKHAKHNFLERIAQKNDRRMDTEPNTFHCSKKNGLTMNRRQLLDSTGDIPKSFPKSKVRRIKTELERGQQKRPIQTIISSKLGVLSNEDIRNKLEEKWYQQQKKQRLIARKQVDEDSDFDQGQDLMLSIRQHSKIQKNQSKKSEKKGEPRNVDLKRLGHQVYEKHLHKILELDQNQKSNRVHAYSQGEEYKLQEGKLMRFDNIYVSRKFELKHKFEWC